MNSDDLASEVATMINVIDKHFDDLEDGDADGGETIDILDSIRDKLYSILGQLEDDEEY